MPDLAAKQQSTRVDLPSTKPEDPAWVELKTQLTLGDFVAIQGVDGQFEQGVALLARVITDWSFTLGGEKAPIDAKTLELLDSGDFIFLSKWVEQNIKIDDSQLTAEQKKAFNLR